MRNASILYQLSVVLNILFVALLAVMVAVLERARSEDAVRITLTSSQVENPRLAPVISDLEQITGREPIAIRLNGNSDEDATLWQLRFEPKEY